jgi:hypothetical protein
VEDCEGRMRGVSETLWHNYAVYTLYIEKAISSEDEEKQDRIMVDIFIIAN